MDEPSQPARDRLIGRRGLLRAAGLAGAAGVGVAALAPDDAESARLTPVKAVSVVDHGAAGNGKADDRRAIQDALDAAGQEGGAVFFPPGDYLVSGPLAPRSNTLLFGSHTPRWRGGVNPPSACKIRMAGRFSGGEGLIEPGGDTWGVTLRNLRLQRQRHLRVRADHDGHELDGRQQPRVGDRRERRQPLERLPRVQLLLLLQPQRQRALRGCGDLGVRGVRQLPLREGGHQPRRCPGTPQRLRSCRR